MVQIRYSILFILAAAAISPVQVVALPLPPSQGYYLPKRHYDDFYGTYLPPVTEARFLHPEETLK